LLAWNKAQIIGEALDHVLAILAVLSAYTIFYSKHTPPKALLNIYNDILSAYPCDGSPTNSGLYIERIVKNFFNQNLRMTPR
jgi:hypothetical protein